MFLARVRYDHRDVRGCSMHIKHNRGRCSLFTFDGRVVPKGAEQWTYALLVFYTTTATTKSVNCTRIMIGIVEWC